jgi:hypothetical protein
MVTHQLLVYGDVNLTENTQAILDATNEIGLEVNAEKTKKMFTSRHQATGQNLTVYKDS